MQLNGVTADSVLLLEFTVPMKFPDDIIDIMNSEGDKEGRYLDIFMYSYTSEVLDPNLIAWTVVEITPLSMSVKLELTKPLDVSQGDEEDKLVVKVAMSQFEDQNGNHLDSLYVLETDIQT